MLITVDRYISTVEATLSRVSVDGEALCYGLEDAYHPVKEPHETRIPAGSYHISVRDWGGFHERYKRDRRFRAFHQGMLWIRNVDNFEYILIHCGNTHHDTDGCLLVGEGADELSMTLRNSTSAYIRLYKKALAAARAGQLSIEFQDNDR